MRPLLSLFAVAAVALMAPTPTAQAEATVLRFEFTTPFTDVVPSDDCRPGISATVAGTEVLVGQRVETPPPSNGVLLHGLISATVTFQFSDGSYGVGESTDRFAAPFVVNGPGQDTAISGFTFAHVDTVTVYDAGGQVIGTATFRLVEHITFKDLAPIGGPPGEEDIVRVDFLRARLTCDM